MEHPVKKIALDYGDARITFYVVDLNIPSSSVPYLHSHCYYELHFLAGTQFVCNLKNEVISLKQNEFILLPPDILHRTDKTLTRELIYTVSLTIERKTGSEKFYDTLVSALKQYALTPLPFPKHLEPALSNLCQTELYRHMQGIFQLKASAATLVSWLFTQLSVGKVPVEPSAGNNMFLIDNMINRADITLEQMAEATNYSRRHISRLIMQRYGCNLTELRRQKKIQKLPEGKQKRQRSI